MKMLFIIYDVDYDGDVSDTLAASCVAGYTKWTRVLGKGERSDPKFDDGVWPGFNCAVVMAVEKELETKVFDALESLHERVGRKALKVFGWPIEKII